MTIKGLVLGALVALTVACSSGCAFLASKGVLSPGDVQAICADAATLCSAAALVNADDTVKQACAAVAATCLGQ